MDLGSLELQIFVSLTVVLGAAFVALVCDYLKGNNEQLREHNIELRVRKEEQERRLLLDPAGFIGQWMSGGKSAAAPAAQAAAPAARPVAAHEVMQSFAAAEALADAESRANRFHSRINNDDALDEPEVPPLTGRRVGRQRNPRRNNRNTRVQSEGPGDWVRPEVIARVARKAEADVVYSSDIRNDVGATKDEARLQPLNAPDGWDIREQIPALEKNRRPVAPPVAPEVEEVTEQVAQVESQSGAPAPGTILRPLTVPSLKLEEELQRVAEATPAPVTLQWHSPLLDEVIAASAVRSVEVEAPVEAAPMIEIEPEPEPVVAETEPAPAEGIPGCYEFGPKLSSLSGMGVTTGVEFLPAFPFVEVPTAKLPFAEPEIEETVVESLPVDLPSLVSLDDVVSEPPPVWLAPVEAVEPPQSAPEPIDISVARHQEPEPVEAAPPPDLLLPTGLHDLSTWTRLLSLPNPMTGFLFVISLQGNENNGGPDRKGSAAVADNGPAIEKLMTSFVREGDFGSRISDNEWVFVYNHDATGFNQRRVGTISEKLWDFQLRHLGMANVAFKWGAIDVKSELLADALEAARDRMNQTRTARKLPGPNTVQPRRAVNA